MLSAVFHGYNLYDMTAEIVGQKEAIMERKFLGQCPLFFSPFFPPILPCDSQVICVKVQYAVLSK